MKATVSRRHDRNLKVKQLCGFLFAVTLACGVRADNLIAVTTSSAVSFGAEGGDTFGLEEVSSRNVMVLLSPRGEDCTLRFPLEIGESLLLRSGPGQGAQIVCEAALVSIEPGSRAQFSYACNDQTVSNEPKCPMAQERTALPAN